jgi:hypothetical protein
MGLTPARFSDVLLTQAKMIARQLSHHRTSLFCLIMLCLVVLVIPALIASISKGFAACATICMVDQD